MPCKFNESRRHKIPKAKYRVSNADTLEIAAAELTPDDVGDLTVLSDLLDQIDDLVASLIADGAYGAQTAYDPVTARHPEAAVVIPPRSTRAWDADLRPRQIERHNGREIRPLSDSCTNSDFEATIDSVRAFLYAASIMLLLRGLSQLFGLTGC